MTPLLSCMQKRRRTKSWRPSLFQIRPTLIWNLNLIQIPNKMVVILIWDMGYQIWAWVSKEKKGGTNHSHEKFLAIFSPFYRAPFLLHASPSTCQKERDLEREKEEEKGFFFSLAFNFLSLLIQHKGVHTSFSYPLRFFFLKKRIRSKSKKQDLQVASISMVSEVPDRHQLYADTCRGQARLRLHKNLEISSNLI